jgi:BirA family transcriptional regulator, biotin operon repressor / biotin---[acetyl-CoA-carboxylase] ligase
VTPEPTFPPPFRPTAVAAAHDAFAAACAAAGSGAPDGALFWNRRLDRCDCAIALTPDEPLARSAQVAYIALLGLADALGALGPPMTALTFVWPDRLKVNGGLVGGIRFAAGKSGTAKVPAWLAVGVDVAVQGNPADPNPGRDPDRTSLHEEGFADVDAWRLHESFSRHFLTWINRWQDDGFAPVRAAWLSRAAPAGSAVALPLPGKPVAGIFAGLDDRGNLLLGKGANQRTVDWIAALGKPTWTR